MLRSNKHASAKLGGGGYRKAHPIPGNHMQLVKAAAKQSHRRFGEAFKELTHR